MANSVKHLKVSTLSDSADPTQTQPSDWNLEHVVTGAADAVHAHTLPSQVAMLSADVTMTNANTGYDGPSLSLSAGKWMVFGGVTVASANATAQRVTAKLWDGSAVLASAEGAAPSQGAGVRGAVSLTLCGAGVLAAPATIKITCLSTTASSLIKAATVDNGAGNNAAYLYAVMIGP